MASTVCNPLSAISRRRRWMAGAGQMKLMTCRNLLIESVHDVSQRGRRITMDSTLRPALCTTPQGNLPSPTPARRCNTPAFSRRKCIPRFVTSIMSVRPRPRRTEFGPGTDFSRADICHKRACTGRGMFCGVTYNNGDISSARLTMELFVKPSQSYSMLAAGTRSTISDATQNGHTSAAYPTKSARLDNDFQKQYP